MAFFTVLNLHILQPGRERGSRRQPAVGQLPDARKPLVDGVVVCSCSEAAAGRSHPHVGGHGRTEFWDAIRDKQVMAVAGATCRVRIWIESGDYVITVRNLQTINAIIVDT